MTNLLSHFPLARSLKRLNAHNLQATELVQRHSAHPGPGQPSAAVRRAAAFFRTVPDFEPYKRRTKSNCQAANSRRSEPITAEPLHQLCIIPVHAQSIREVVAHQFVRLQFIATQRTQKQVSNQPPIDQLFDGQSFPQRISR